MVKTKSQIKKIFIRLREELEARGVKVEQMVLFGSYASGNPSAYSDIDIAVISSSFDRKDIIARQEILGDAAASIGTAIDAIGYGAIESRKRRSSFLDEILHSGRLVYSA